MTEQTEPFTKAQRVAIMEELTRALATFAEVPPAVPQDEVADAVSEDTDIPSTEDASGDSATDSPLPSEAYWAGVIVAEGELTGDARLIEPGALTWGDFPMPLRSVSADVGAHDGAVLVGSILAIERAEDGRILARGDFDMTTEEGQAAYTQMQSGRRTGVSVDLDNVSFEVRIAAEVWEEMNAEFLSPVAGNGREEGEESEAEETLSDDTPELPVDDEGRVIVSKVASDEEIFVTTSARIRAATLVDIPAFAEARLEVVTEQDAERDTVSESVTDVRIDTPELSHIDRAALVASAVETALAAPITPPANWFTDPNLSAPTPLTITEEGHVFGHLATWDVCHTGSPAGRDVCVTAPHSASGYARFHTGSILLDNGECVAAGRITMNTGHAGARLDPRATVAHYDNTGTAVADIRCGEDAYGIWFAGALRPEVTPAQIRALRGSPLSGDWRAVNGSLELHAALAVNMPGFPIPRTAGLVASGSLQSLVASGMLVDDTTRERVRAFAVERLYSRVTSSRVTGARMKIERFARSQRRPLQ